MTNRALLSGLAGLTLVAVVGCGNTNNTVDHATAGNTTAINTTNQTSPTNTAANTVDNTTGETALATNTANGTPSTNTEANTATGTAAGPSTNSTNASSPNNGTSSTDTGSQAINRPSGAWVDTFEKRLYKNYQVTPSRYEYIGNGSWEVWVKEIHTGAYPYVTVNQYTGDFHG